MDFLRSQFVTSKIGRGGNRYLPRVFTEHGVAMLSGILKSDQAIDVNIQIIRVFTQMRQLLQNNHELRELIDDLKKKTSNNTQNIELVFQYLDELVEKKESQEPRTKIG